MPNAAPDILDRLVMMTATTKTFNIAGAHIGNVIIPDPALRARFADPDDGARDFAQQFRDAHGHRRLFARGRGLGGRADGLSRRQPPPLRRGHRTRSRASPRCRSRRPISPGSISPGTGMSKAEFTRPGRDRRPVSPPTTATASARAAKPSCASTSPRRGPTWPRPSRGCRTRFSDLQ